MKKDSFKIGILNLILFIEFFTVVLFVIYFVWVGWSENHQEIKTYEISDLGDGVYVKYSETVSSIPAENYQIAIYKIGNKIFTTRGNIEIYFTEDRPIVEIKESLYVNNQTAIFYVPETGVECTSIVKVG